MSFFCAFFCFVLRLQVFKQDLSHSGEQGAALAKRMDSGENASGIEFSHYNPMVRQARGAPTQAGGGVDGWIRARINTNPAASDRHSAALHGDTNSQAAMDKAAAMVEVGARAQVAELTMQTRTEPSRSRV